MHISIDDQIIGQLVAGIVSVFILVGVGVILTFASRAIGRKFAFTRLALVLALPPFCLINLLDRGSVSTLYLYGIIVVVLGMAVDAIHHLLPRKEPLETDHGTDTETGEPNSDAVVWEKAE